VRTGGLGGTPKVLKKLQISDSQNGAVLCATLRRCDILQKPICSIGSDKFKNQHTKKI